MVKRMFSFFYLFGFLCFVHIGEGLKANNNYSFIQKLEPSVFLSDSIYKPEKSIFKIQRLVVSVRSSTKRNSIRPEDHTQDYILVLNRDSVSYFRGNLIPGQRKVEDYVSPPYTKKKLDKYIRLAKRMAIDKKYKARLGEEIWNTIDYLFSKLQYSPLEEYNPNDNFHLSWDNYIEIKLKDGSELKFICHGLYKPKLLIDAIYSLMSQIRFNRNWEKIREGDYPDNIFNITPEGSIFLIQGNISIMD